MKIAAAGTVRPPVSRVGRDAANSEAAGFAGLFFPDHLMGWFPEAIWHPRFTAGAAARPNAHDYLDPVACLMAGAAQTSSIRLGLGVTDLLRSHPATVARTALTLDHFTEGRFILGLGAGEAENLTPYGLSADRLVSRLEEGLEIIRALWETTEPVAFDGANWRLRHAVLGLEPRDGVPPPIWLAARGPRMRSITARLADGWLPMFLTPDEYTTSLGAIRGERATRGVQRAFEPAFYSFMVIGDSRDQCLEMFQSPVFRTLGLLLPAERFAAHGLSHPLGDGAYGLLDFVPTAMDEETALRAAGAVPPELAGEAFVYGSIDDIVEQLEQYETAGCEMAVLANVSFLTDLGRARTSYDAFLEIARHFAGRPAPGQGTR